MMANQSKLKYKNNYDEVFFEAINQALSSVDLPILGTVNTKLVPLIYIVGLPRSGTTLLSQLMSRYLPVGYINNITARFWLRPAVGIRLTQALYPKDIGREYITFKSNLGKTSGPSDPHEFGYFWSYWFNFNKHLSHNLPADAVINREGLTKVLENEIIGSFGMPVIVFKNLTCGFQAELLTELHPNSIFVYVKRDISESAASLLEARKQLFGDERVFFSLKPSTYPFAKEISPTEEIMKQMVDCENEITKELNKKSVTSIAVNYKNMCKNPLSTLKKICEKINNFDCSIQPLSDDIPSFEPSIRQKLSNTPYIT